jgi:(p)ppGpp synthase/HD superfamily hydrolase
MSITAASFPGGSEDSVMSLTNPILRAAAVARDAHKGQTRKYNGRPYITHPGRVAARASILPYADEHLVAAAWLHDTVEDTNLTLDDLKGWFGEEIASIVHGLTNQFDKASYPDMNRKQRKTAEIERLAKAPREVKVLKMLDRIDNLREMGQDEDFAKLYLRESRDLLIALGNADLELGRELQGLIDDAGRGIL